MSSLPPATRHSLVESAIEILKSNITSGIWQVGQRIPTELDLAKQLEVGRNTVREAVRTLAYSGVLDVRQGDGTYVRRNVDPADTMRNVDRAARGDHLELQCMLETECARYAARRRTDADLATLRKLLKARGEREASRDVKKFVERDRAFHIAVAAASHNHALEALYRYFSGSILANVEDVLVELDKAAIPEPDLQAHQALLDAIEQRDENKAVRATLAILKPQMTWLETHETHETPAG
ncbi:MULTISPECIES: FadR/GntR family transcriptional regulator [Burkholderia]|uniref:GntR family transcriptional regulator n=1 Tax=Burkholderia aenigmatica TaxID=2015348 RepID=A0A6J5J293_9BURK|nr:MULTISPECIES: FadR/GntR family transcriptional regulator [Burkholderia]AYQ44249.1 FadR family transcriptional regulator [Burkholderia lata]CAB3965685.1 GntR family transcriptional regulator [Burkholderia aenigmatica]